MSNKKKNITEIILRLDDLREAESRRVNEQMAIRADYGVQLDVAEAKRIDAIRSVDIAAVSVASDRATQQAIVLANQVSASAETLRTLVAATAATVAQQLADLTTQFSDRISSLEKTQYQDSGSKGGIKDLAGWIVSAVIALVAIATFVIPKLK